MSLVEAGFGSRSFPTARGRHEFFVRPVARWPHSKSLRLGTAALISMAARSPPKWSNPARRSAVSDTLVSFLRTGVRYHRSSTVHRPVSVVANIRRAIAPHPNRRYMSTEMGCSPREARSSILLTSRRGKEKLREGGGCGGLRARPEIAAMQRLRAVDVRWQGRRRRWCASD